MDLAKFHKIQNGRLTAISRQIFCQLQYNVNFHQEVDGVGVSTFLAVGFTPRFNMAIIRLDFIVSYDFIPPKIYHPVFGKSPHII